MVNDVEQYLFEKFKSGVDAKDSKGNPRIALHSHFEELMPLLDRNIQLGSSQDDSSTDKSSRDTSTLHHLYYLNNILTECQATSKKRVFTNWSIRRSLRKIKDEIKDINEKQKNTQTRNRDTGESSGPSSWKSQTLRWSSPAVDLDKIYGLEDEVERLKKSLLTAEVNFKAIGVVGIAGIGKTTLCQKLFINEVVRSHFAPRIWVCVSRRHNEDDDIRVAILKRMLLELGVEEEEVITNDSSSEKLGELLSLLHQHLWGKRYLIVFDDVREDREWYQGLGTYLSRGKKWEDKLAYGLPKGHDGTVIVTSRSEEVAKMMVGPESLHQKMPIREVEHCWLIFKDAAGLQGSNPEESNLEELKKEVMDKSRGVPLAAKVMGETVKKHIQEQSQNGNANTR